MNTILRALRSCCTAAYRISVIILLLDISSNIALSNRHLLAIGSMLFKVIGGPPT